MRIYAIIFFFFEQKTAYEMRISDWSSDVCSSDLDVDVALDRRLQAGRTVISEIDTVLMCSEIVADVGGQIGVVLDEQDAHLSFLPLLFALRVDLRRTRHHDARGDDAELRSEEHTSELQSLMRISYAVFCLKKKNTIKN